MSREEFLELEHLSDLEALDAMLKRRINESINPMIQTWNLFMKIIGAVAIVAVGCAGFLFIQQMELNKEMATKASKEEVKKEFDGYLNNYDFLRITDMSNKMLKEAILNPPRAEYVLRDITDHAATELGYTFTMRGIEQQQTN